MMNSMCLFRLRHKLVHYGLTAIACFCSLLSFSCGDEQNPVYTEPEYPGAKNVIAFSVSNVFNTYAVINWTDTTRIKGPISNYHYAISAGTHPDSLVELHHSPSDSSSLLLPGRFSEGIKYWFGIQKRCGKTVFPIVLDTGSFVFASPVITHVAQLNYECKISYKIPQPFVQRLYIQIGVDSNALHTTVDSTEVLNGLAVVRYNFQPNVKYFVRIFFKGGDAISNYSNVVGITATWAQSSFTATTVREDSIVLSLPQPPPGTRKAVIWLSKGAAFEPIDSISPTLLSYTHRLPLIHNTTYSYRLEYLLQKGTQIFPGTADVRFLFLPVTGFSCTKASESSFTLAWLQVNEYDTLRLEIERKVNSSDEFQLLVAPPLRPASVTFQQTLYVDSVYTYRLRAKSRYNVGSYLYVDIRLHLLPPEAITLKNLNENDMEISWSVRQLEQVYTILEKSSDPQNGPWVAVDSVMVPLNKLTVSDNWTSVGLVAFRLRGRTAFNYTPYSYTVSFLSPRTILENKYIFIPAGTFSMGSNDGFADERPTHLVSLSSYFIGATEVSQALWKYVMGADNNPSYFKADSLPVTNVTYDEILQFMSRTQAKLGKACRLPTEAEWEYAARGAFKSRGYTYSGSNIASWVAWSLENANSPARSGLLQPNEVGLFDMSGNVWEWCADLYRADYYANSPVSNPQGPASGDYRVQRGGSFHLPQQYCRVAKRSWALPQDRNFDTGFRIAWSF